MGKIRLAIFLFYTSKYCNRELNELLSGVLNSLDVDVLCLGKVPVSVKHLRTATTFFH